MGVLLGVAVLAGTGLRWYHGQPQFCGLCHIMQPYVASWQNGDLLAKAHAEAGVTCLECHEPTTEQQVDEAAKYIKGEYQTPLRQRAFQKEWCFRCHEHESYSQVAELAAELVDQLGRNPHASHWGELECRICHKMHKPSQLYCAQCHDVPALPGWQG